MSKEDQKQPTHIYTYTNKNEFLLKEYRKFQSITKFLNKLKNVARKPNNYKSQKLIHYD
ncbi:hypothetical protein HC766_02145 [Candidatus Gracilibacteria bacterium]|nr:hypothetical protein [Thermales bacterium]NJL97101.1 hypothetical protein [Candidatus Gracilibacteria bacterium]NJS41162.1 hypothetical protein [Candidatus Gracilibacteria bacterium]